VLEHEFRLYQLVVASVEAVFSRCEVRYRLRFRVI
jgi:hypothetical protein